MTLVSCAGSVRESADDPAGGHPSAAAGSPAASLEDDRSGAGGSASGAAPAGPKPALVSSAGNRSAQPDNEHGGDAGGGGAEPALVGAAGAPDEAEVTRTLVDEPLLPRGFLSALQYRSDPDQASVYTIEAISRSRAVHGTVARGCSWVTVGTTTVRQAPLRTCRACHCKTQARSP